MTEHHDDDAPDDQLFDLIRKYLTARCNQDAPGDNAAAARMAGLLQQIRATRAMTTAGATVKALVQQLECAAAPPSAEEPDLILVLAARLAEAMAVQRDMLAPAGPGDLQRQQTVRDQVEALTCSIGALPAGGLVPAAVQLMLTLPVIEDIPDAAERARARRALWSVLHAIMAATGNDLSAYGIDAFAPASADPWPAVDEEFSAGIAAIGAVKADRAPASRRVAVAARPLSEYCGVMAAGVVS